jgi:glycosyltransferase involved in cell wall biosynthesis
MALRVLTQINYSAGENADGDSGLNFTAGLLQALVAKSADLHFYVLVPERHAAIWAAALDHSQITPIVLPLQPRLHGGDFQFDPAELYRRFDFRRFDVDILFLNQPETAPAFLQFFNRQTFHNVPAITYVHWFDTRRPSTPKQLTHEPALLAALAGMSVSEAVGCSSRYGRDLVLAKARRWFHEDAVASLRERINILPPPVDAEKFTARRRRRTDGPPLIVVNHRLLKYTGVRSTLTTVLPRLWRENKNFRVHVTNPSRARLPGTILHVPWLTVGTLSRHDYVKLLRTSDIVLAPHRATHWSISTLEAICAGCVPLMNSESFFPEMFEPILSELPCSVGRHISKRWFYFRASVIGRLQSLLENLDEERDIAKAVARRAGEIYGWDAWVDPWLEVFYTVERKIPIMADRNPSLVRIINMLRRNGATSKQLILRELGWAPKDRSLSWTAFRKNLRQVAWDDSRSAEAIFELYPGHVLQAFEEALDCAPDME